MLVVLGWQTYTWFRLGTWPELPFAEAFLYFDIDLRFIYNPTDWFGAAKVAQWILGAPFSVCGALIIILTAGIVKSFISDDADEVTEIERP